MGKPLCRRLPGITVAFGCLYGIAVCVVRPYVWKGRLLCFLRLRHCGSLSRDGVFGLSCPDASGAWPALSGAAAAEEYREKRQPEAAGGVPSIYQCGFCPASLLLVTIKIE